MTGKYLICDGCRRELRLDSDLMGRTSGGYDAQKWITVARSYGRSGDALLPGSYNFCCDACLIDKLTTGPISFEQQLGRTKREPQQPKGEE